MTTAVERNRKVRKKLRESGGRVLTVNLSPAATRALERLAGDGTDRAAVESALLRASPPPIESDSVGWLDLATKGR